jgi:hypothetical protein
MIKDVHAIGSGSVEAAIPFQRHGTLPVSIKEHNPFGHCAESPLHHTRWNANQVTVDQLGTALPQQVNGFLVVKLYPQSLQYLQAGPMYPEGLFRRHACELSIWQMR